MALKIEEVKDKKSLADFIGFPWQLYRGNPQWIAPLRYELFKRLDMNKNPFFRKGKGVLLLARDGKKIVGRLSVSINGRNAERSLDAEGNFGCYECVSDISVGRSLMDEGLGWLRKNNVKKVVGPIHFRLEDPYPGFLVEGHEYSPYFMMTYSLPYYGEQMEKMGFKSVMDLHSYEVSAENPLPDLLLRKAAEAAEIKDLKLRNVNMKNLYAESEAIGEIFNDALKNNWGHVPFSKRHVRQMAKDLKLLADSRIIFIAEVRERPIAAVINLPNYNELFSDLNGRLFPRGIFRALFAKKRIKSLRGYAMAVRDEFRGTGLGCLMLRQSFVEGKKAGYERGEITWILGNNNPMNKLAEFMGGNRSKTYRLYRMDL